jgi:TatA/E family protein of Tat protein translocase
MFGLHAPELIIVLVVALLIFGPKKLPEMGSAIGKTVKSFRKGMNELNEPEIPPLPKDELEAPALPVSSKDMHKLENSSFASTSSEEAGAKQQNN